MMLCKNIFYVTMLCKACISKNTSKQKLHLKNCVKNKDLKKANDFAYIKRRIERLSVLKTLAHILD